MVFIVGVFNVLFSIMFMSSILKEELTKEDGTLNIGWLFSILSLLSGMLLIFNK